MVEQYGWYTHNELVAVGSHGLRFAEISFSPPSPGEALRNMVSRSWSMREQSGQGLGADGGN
jgi:hypothetical protein